MEVKVTGKTSSSTGTTEGVIKYYLSRDIENGGLKYMQTAKALMRLCERAGSPESLLWQTSLVSQEVSTDNSHSEVS